MTSRRRRLTRPAHSERSRLGFAVVLPAVLGLLLAGCGSGSSGSRSTTKLVVFAASSLTETFTAMQKAFVAAHPDVKVVLSFDSSSVLVQQIESGASVDVIATADEESMQPLVAKSLLVGHPTTFATNHLIVVTPKNNPGHVTGLPSLSTVSFVECDPSAPCGAASQQVLAAAGVTAKPRSLEQNVKSVLTKITTGEADAGLVYVTDAVAAGSQVRSFPIPANQNVTTKNLIAPVKASRNAKLAQEWIDYVTSSAGQKVLRNARFGAP
jgi:molybdate transport system substrate-binding protein